MLAALLLLTSCAESGAATRSSTRHTLFGNVLLRLTLARPDPFRVTSSDCFGATHGLSVGSAVRVSDLGGRTIGNGTLLTPLLLTVRDLGYGTQYSFDCAWVFIVKGLPNESFYTIWVPGISPARISRSFLMKNNWAYTIVPLSAPSSNAP
jgi:hypothetical protein